MRFWKKLPFDKAKKPAKKDESVSAYLQAIEKKIDYRFNDHALLELALTHPSNNTNKNSLPNNQRLEFLGDSILGAILSSELYDLFLDEDEGSLSRKKAIFARGSYLAELASSLNLDKYVRMSDSERMNNGHLRKSTLEDVLEAVVGAIYLDGGYEKTRECVLSWIGDLKTKLEMQRGIFNPKGKLQEFIQSRSVKEKIKYSLLNETGPEHNKRFVVELHVGCKKISDGRGTSKKEAEENAAESALNILFDNK